MIAVLITAAIFHFGLGLSISADAVLVAVAVGMVADSVRSNRIKDKEAALAMVKGMAEGITGRRP